MHRYRLVLLDDDEEPVGQIAHKSDEDYRHNQWIVLGEGIWLVAGIEPTTTP